VTRAVRNDFNTDAENVGSMMTPLSIAVFRSYTTGLYENFLYEFFKTLLTMVITDKMHLPGNFLRLHTIA
jgi:hypothetical protein